MKAQICRKWYERSAASNYLLSRLFAVLAQMFPFNVCDWGNCYQARPAVSAKQVYTRSVWCVINGLAVLLFGRWCCAGGKRSRTRAIRQHIRTGVTGRWVVGHHRSPPGCCWMEGRGGVALAWDKAVCWTGGISCERSRCFPVEGMSCFPGLEEEELNLTEHTGPDSAEHAAVYFKRMDAVRSVTGATQFLKAKHIIKSFSGLGPPNVSQRCVPHFWRLSHPSVLSFISLQAGGGCRAGSVQRLFWKGVCSKDTVNGVFVNEGMCDRQKAKRGRDRVGIWDHVCRAPKEPVTRDKMPIGAFTWSACGQEVDFMSIWILALVKENISDVFYMYVSYIG